MKNSQKDLLKSCATIGEDDGIDPRILQKRYKNSHNKCRKVHRKNQQLCSQVVQALNLAFADIDNDIIASLYAVRAVPMPNITRLLVTVTQRETTPVILIQKEIARYHNRFRYEIATTIHRKKVPHLAFVIE
ncbi:hypothetical protein [Candidatus Uabimicrobium sp. HlEnr_7]|uniref:hypothetical protein n=1 Tax=Candidatus Uabimicrobium helgolandensis TaxID=3095367 RepID=UPI0035580A80